ncbi:hypothetical protein Bca101_057087 [Brassica carinata]
MKPGSVYKLDNFYGTSNKTNYRVSEHAVTVSFSWNSKLSVLHDSTTPFDEDRFDVVGHMKLVNGQSLIEPPVLDEVETAKKRHLLVHVQSHECEVVTKREPMTIKELFSYIKQESAQEAFFECTATIDDVVHGSPWYYISCSGCHTKATKGPTSLMCGKCGKVNIVGVPQYRAKISVYDNSDQAVNGDQGVEHEVPVPEALISTIGQRHKFCVKVTEHNLSGKARSLTVTKILSLDTSPATDAPEGIQNNASLEEAVGIANKESQTASSLGDEGSKRTCATAHPETAKRKKCGD